MEGELIRFRVDGAIKDKAAEVCDKLGFDLADVLRAFVTRLAQEGTLPFDLGRPAAPRPHTPPFTAYSERLWSEFKSVDGEVALALLWHFVAERAARIDREESQPRPDPDLLARLRQELADARGLAQTLDPKDAEAVASVLARYGPLITSLK